GESAAGVISTAVAWRPRLRRRMAEPAGPAPARDGAASCPACVGPGAQIAHPARASPRPWRLLRRTGAPARVRRWKTRPPHPPVRPPSEADQVIGIHRPVVEPRPAAVDFVDLLRRREAAPAQGWISLALGTRQRSCGEVPLKLLDTLYGLLAFHREGHRGARR